MTTPPPSPGTDPAEFAHTVDMHALHEAAEATKQAGVTDIQATAPVPGPDTPRWTIDDDDDDALVWFEPNFCLYPDESLIEESEDSADWENAGLPPAAHAALVADVRAARVHEGCAHTTDTLQRAQKLAHEVYDMWADHGPDKDPSIPVAATLALLDLLMAEGPDHE